MSPTLNLLFMRRFFTFVVFMVSMVVFTGCRHNSETHVKEVEFVDHVYRTEYDGHSYIMFKHNGSTNMHNVTGVVHDPDCPCNR